MNDYILGLSDVKEGLKILSRFEEIPLPPS